MKHPITNEEINFNSKEEFINFLQLCNPSMIRKIREEYEAKYPNYEIKGFGLGLKIIKKEKK